MFCSAPHRRNLEKGYVFCFPRKNRVSFSDAEQMETASLKLLFEENPVKLQQEGRERRVKKASRKKRITKFFFLYIFFHYLYLRRLNYIFVADFLLSTLQTVRNLKSEVPPWMKKDNVRDTELQRWHWGQKEARSCATITLSLGIHLY